MGRWVAGRSVSSGHTTRLEAALAARYRIERELGAGGVASGYRFDIRPDGAIVRIRTSPVRQLILLQNWQSLLQGES